MPLTTTATHAITRFFPITGRASALALVALAGSHASAEVPTNWTIEIVARSSLEASIPPYRLPFPSSLSSQPVAVDEAGGVSFRSFLGSNTEGIFYGDVVAGGNIITGFDGSGDPVFSGSLDVFNGRIAVTDGGFNGGASVYDTSGVLINDYLPGGSLGVSGLSGPSLSADGALCYRADFGFTGDRAVVDEFIMGVRTQTEIANSFSGEFSFIFTPKMNASRQVALNTIPVSGPTRRLFRYDPDGSGYTRTMVAETGGIYNAFYTTPAIGNDGSIATNARRSADSIWEVVRFDPTDGRVVIAEGNTNGIVSSNLANFPPVVNGNGLVAFRVEDSTTGSTSLFVGDGENLVRLVAAGDLMDTDLGPIPAGFDFGGSTGVQTMNSSVDINDANQVAFMAFLQNGTIGVFVATPIMNECVGDWNTSGAVDIFDILDYLADWEAMDEATDLTGEGDINIFDILAFLDAWQNGCP